MPSSSNKPNKVFEALRGEFKDIDREIVHGESIVQEHIDVETQGRLVNQVNDEYEASIRFSEEKRAIGLARLRLYNNQRRARSSVGDPLMFTVFNTIHASLYVDQLMTAWKGRNENDDEVEENLNALSKFDYGIMGKSEIDYYWNWDAEFFGRGLLLMMEFNREPGIMAPAPELLDPMTFIRDPRATSVNGLGNSMKGAMRFGGWEVGATYYEMKDNPAYFNCDLLRKDKDIRSLIDVARQARDEAQGRDRFYPDEDALDHYGNYEFQLLNWLTTIKGERYLITLANSRSTVVRLFKLKYGMLWPVIDRSLFPMSNDWDGVSIPDITEDKQRARAKLLNLGVKSAVIDALPQYMYDRTRIKNKNELNWKSNKFIGVDGRVDNAMMPVQKSVVHQYVNVIMDMLDQSVQRATATPEIQQGVPQGDKRTLGELNKVSANVDTRYGMSAKVYGWAEAKFWLQWYRMYKIYFKNEIDEKVVRIQGPLAPIWRPLTRENIIAQRDPDVEIESLVLSEAKRIREQQSFDQFAVIAIQDPDTNKRYLLKKGAKLRGMTKEEIDMLFPPTVDEEQAERENELLNQNELPKINARDDHRIHIEIHSKANMTSAARAHIRMHQELALQVRNKPELFPQQVAQPFQPPTGLGQPNNAPVRVPAQGMANRPPMPAPSGVASPTPKPTPPR
jgi:hypothetical protein